MDPTLRRRIAQVPSDLRRTHRPLKATTTTTAPYARFASSGRFRVRGRKSQRAHHTFVPSLSHPCTRNCHRPSDTAAGTSATQCRSRGAAFCAQVMASVFSASNQSRLSKWKSSESGPSPLWEFEPTTEETGLEFDPLEPAGANSILACFVWAILPISSYSTGISSAARHMTSRKPVCSQRCSRGKRSGAPLTGSAALL